MLSINENAIIVNADQTPGQVVFHNFEEIKAYMETGLSVYKNTEYSAENLDQAKEDLEILKGIKKKLTDKKKELENGYSMPFEEVKKQLDELIDMVKEPMDVIDKMIKEHEKEAKRIEIEEYARQQAAALGELADKVVGSGAFFNPKWLNATYKTKDWKKDVDEIIQNAADAFETINTTGGKNKSTLLAYYFDKLTLDGAKEFMENATADVDGNFSVFVEDENAVVGYKILKIYGTERQMLRLMSQLDLSDYEYEEIEDGMPKEMNELTVPDFDSFVAFDIEHTGTYGIDNGDAEAEITEIGAVKVENGQIVARFDMLANPGRKIVPMAAKLTHITNVMVANEPPVDEVIKKFKEFVGDSILVGHNIKGCDIPHITRAAKRAGVNFDNSYLDTKKLAKSLKDKKGWDKITLPYLSKYYDIPQTEAHRAWCDAEANAYVYLKLKEE